MLRLKAIVELSPSGRWVRGVVLGTLATAATTTWLGGLAGLLVAVVVVAATLSGQLLFLVQQRSRWLRDEILNRLVDVRTEHADETVDTRSHDSAARVRLVLSEYTPTDPAVARALDALRGAFDAVEHRLEVTRRRREQWEAIGAPALVGGLASRADAGAELKLYGDPANVPGWLTGRRARSALLQVGRVLDDVRLLHSNQIEWVVLTFTLWARALLLVIAPALGALSIAPPPDLDGWPRVVPWIVVTAWALCTALVAPQIATLAMAESPQGQRARRVLLAVELPLAVAVALTTPGWPVVAFAAGWTNWWQRLGVQPAIPDFSWTRLAAWIGVTVASQSAGLAIAGTDAAVWRDGLEVALTLGVIAIIGGSYGAMLPVSAGVTARVLISGTRHRRLADTDAQRVIDDVAEAMTRAADHLADLTVRTAADEEAEDVLRRAVDSMLATGAARPRDSSTLGAVVTAALAEGGHAMWSGDPRAAATQNRARREGRAAPVVVEQPAFASDDLEGVVLRDEVAGTLQRLLVACIVEARVHGTRRVQTILRQEGTQIEVRVANAPNPQATHSGRGRGRREISALARCLPGGEEPFRGLTDRAFVGARGDGELFGVRFAFTVGDTPPRASGATRARV